MKCYMCVCVRVVLIVVAFSKKLMDCELKL